MLLHRWDVSVTLLVAELARKRVSKSTKCESTTWLVWTHKVRGRGHLEETSPRVPAGHRYRQEGCAAPFTMGGRPATVHANSSALGRMVAAIPATANGSAGGCTVARRRRQSWLLDPGGGLATLATSNKSAHGCPTAGRDDAPRRGNDSSSPRVPPTSKQASATVDWSDIRRMQRALGPEPCSDAAKSLMRGPETLVLTA